MNQEHQAKMESLAVAIRKFLLDRGMWQDVRIYFNGKAFDSVPVYDHGDGVLSSEYKSGAKNINYNNPDYLHVVENIDPEDYMDYYNRDTITMSFEGDFYEALNYGEFDGGSTVAVFSKLLEDHGYYYELGNAWNLALQPTQ